MGSDISSVIVTARTENRREGTKTDERIGNAKPSLLGTSSHVPSAMFSIRALKGCVPDSGAPSIDLRARLRRLDLARSDHRVFGC